MKIKSNHPLACHDLVVDQQEYITTALATVNEDCRSYELGMLVGEETPTLIY